MLTARLAAVVGLEAGRLDLVALPTLSVEPLARLIGAFRGAYPGIVVHVEAPEENDAIATRVRSGRSEIGLGDLPIDEPGLVTEQLLIQELVVVVPPTSPLAGRRRLTIKDLATVPLVLAPPESPMRRRIEAAFADAGMFAHTRGRDRAP